MSDKELAWLDVLRDLDHQRLTANAAAEIVVLGRRQVLRLLKAYRTSGVGGLILLSASGQMATIVIGLVRLR